MIAFTLSTFEWQNSIDEDIVHTYMSAGPLVFLYPLRFVRLHMSVGHCLLPVKHAVIHISIIARKALQIGKGYVKHKLETSVLILIGTGSFRNHYFVHNSHCHGFHTCLHIQATCAGSKI